MYTKKTYSSFQMAWWTRFETLLFLIIIVAWVFHTMERIGRTGENPFEAPPMMYQSQPLHEVLKLI
jgi:hypothetical protein